MTNQEKNVVLTVLQEVYHGGIAYTHGNASCVNGLSWWKRLINWLLRGADKQPFTDPLNYTRITRKMVKDIVDTNVLVSAMKQLAPDPPVCKQCGGTKLVVDTAGHFCHATDWRGAPLLCKDCVNG